MFRMIRPYAHPSCSEPCAAHCTRRVRTAATRTGVLQRARYSQLGSAKLTFRECGAENVAADPVTCIPCPKAKLAHSPCAGRASRAHAATDAAEPCGTSARPQAPGAPPNLQARCPEPERAECLFDVARRLWRASGWALCSGRPRGSQGSQGSHDEPWRARALLRARSGWRPRACGP